MKSIDITPTPEALEQTRQLFEETRRDSWEMICLAESFLEGEIENWYKIPSHTMKRAMESLIIKETERIRQTNDGIKAGGFEPSALPDLKLGGVSYDAKEYVG